MIVLSGASASGKTEVAKKLAEKYKITKVITTTTRDMRIGEVNGRDYFFVSKDKFIEMMNEDRFVETTIYNDNYYGSTKDQIADNRCIVIDPVGLKSYIALKDPNIVTFFLEASEKIRKQRMIDRGDDPIKIKSRISNDHIAFSKDKLSVVDFLIESETSSVEEVADVVYQKYINKINNLK